MAAKACTPRRSSSILAVALLAAGLCALLRGLPSAAPAFLAPRRSPPLRCAHRGDGARGRLALVPRPAVRLQDRTVKELKDLLRRAKLPVSGRKDELVKRLEGAGSSKQEAPEPEGVELEEEEPEGEEEPAEEEEPEEEEPQEEVAPMEELTLNALKDLLKKAKLPVSGKKAVLVERLKQAGYCSAKGKEPAEEKEKEEKGEEEPKAKKAPKRPTKKKAGSIFAIGEEVDGYSDDDEDWFHAKVVADLGSGRFRVEWDEDGESYDLGPGYIRRRHEGMDRNGPFQPGEPVEALCREDGLWYQGVLQQENSDGTFTLLWDEDGEEYTAGPDAMIKVMPRMEFSELTRGAKFKGRVSKVVDFGAFVDIGAVKEGLVPNECIPPPSKDLPPFLEGDRVQALYAEENEWYPATVNEDNGDGTYTITWDDDDDEPHTAKRNELKLQSPRPGVKVNDLIDIWVRSAVEDRLFLSMFPPEYKKQVLRLLSPGEELTGTVAKVLDFGVFVRIEVPGSDGKVVDGLVGAKVLKTHVERGQEVQVRVLNVQPELERLSLIFQ